MKKLFLLSFVFVFSVCGAFAQKNLSEMPVKVASQMGIDITEPEAVAKLHLLDSLSLLILEDLRGKKVKGKRRMSVIVLRRMI